MKILNLTYRMRRYIVKKGDRENIRHISETLDEILAVLPKPKSRAEKVLEIAVTGVTLLSIIGIIEIIKSWIGG